MTHLYSTPDDWLSYYQRLAAQRGGTCLSNKYVTSKTKLRWRCAEGHEWETAPDNIKQGSWCKICGNKRQGRQKAKSIEAAQLLARANGGECLSEEYINNKTKLRWKCGKGHEWEAATVDIQQGKWCPRCAGRFPPDEAIRELKALAKNRGGACLSERYLGARTKHRWKCAEGHEWEAVPYSVRAGTWCPHCAGFMKLSLKDMQETARSMGGECLSTEYSNSDEKLLWRCAAGHTWRAVGYHVRAGHWCPICMAGNSERICKDIFEQLFGKPFLRARPSWLLNSRGKKMELDGYCKELKLAFEYQGVQHFMHNDFFHRGGVKDLVQRKRDDDLKVRLCHEHGVHLIVIPHTLPLSEIPDHVYQIMQKRSLLTNMTHPDDVQVAEFVLPDKINEMKLLAEQRGGVCLSNFYVNNSTSLIWKCAQGHEWEATPGSIQQGSWCPVCAGRLPPEQAFQQLQEITRSKDGRCLSGSYEGVLKKLHWRCALGHEWEATPRDIRRGSWCPECAKKVMGPN